MGDGDQQQVRGIHELYRPTNETAEVDIVAVHGLNGRAIKTWTSGDICWLNHPDFLPKYVRRARVLAWGYNANTSTWMGKSTSSDRILQHAQTLVQELYADRHLEDAKDRPIIFICHSLGGIIVKRALTYSKSCQSSKVAHLHSIYTCTFGILFFGTPHQGSNKANLLVTLHKIASFTIPRAAIRTESNLVKALEEGSEILQDITDQFAPLMANFRVFFFWEQEKTNLKTSVDYIVTEMSAAPILDNTERSGIAADHSSMCKFDKNTAQGFRTAVAALRRYSQEAPEIIRPRLVKSIMMLNNIQRHKAMELLRGIQPVPGNGLLSETLHRTQDSTPRESILDNTGHQEIENH